MDIINSMLYMLYKSSLDNKHIYNSYLNTISDNAFKQKYNLREI